MKTRILFFALLFPALVSYAQNGRDNDFDVIHYEIRLDVLDFSAKIIHGHTTVTFCPATIEFNTINLELRKLTVDSVCFDNQPVTNFTHAGNDLQIILPATISPGDTAAVSIFYQGVPHSESWGGFHFSGQYAFNLGVGFVSKPPNLGKAWFPCKDDFFDRALYDFHIRVSDNNKAVCGGLLQSVTTHGDGTQTFHWKMDFTIPTYLASVAVGDYVEVCDTFSGMNRDIPISIHVRPADQWKVAGSFANLHTIMANLENRFGPYPFERIGYTGTALGAMEHAGNISYPNGSIDNTLNSEWLYTHEISHMWFGNKVTCAGPGEMWLNEGWAVWTELLYREDLYNRETALTAQRSKHREILQKLHTPLGDGGYYPLYNIPVEIVYGETVYQKGGLVVQTLRNYLGDELFFPAIRAYLNNFAFSHATTFNLRDALSLHSGVDLTAFFDSWVFQPGFPHFAIDSFTVAEQGVEVFVRQKGKGRDFIGDANIVEITFMNHNQEIFSDTMRFDGVSGSKVFQPPFEPALVMLDYNDKICDATTDQTKLIATTGTHSFSDLLCKLVVNAAPDTAFVRLTHHWVPPDPLKNPQQGLILSPYRYWSVDGIIPAGFDSEIHFTYMVSGYIDNTLITNTADSLFILYRPNPGYEWQSVSFTRAGTWQAGVFKLDTLRLGEYTLAKADATFVGNRQSLHNSSKNLKCYPNPGYGTISIEWEPVKANRIEISGMDGKMIKSLPTLNYQNSLEVNTRNLSPGVYGVILFSESNEPVAATKMVVTANE